MGEILVPSLHETLMYVIMYIVHVCCMFVTIDSSRLQVCVSMC